MNQDNNWQGRACGGSVAIVGAGLLGRRRRCDLRLLVLVVVLRLCSVRVLRRRRGIVLLLLQKECDQALNLASSQYCSLCVVSL